MKDIFLDTNLARNILNPMPVEYKTFYKWLVENGALVITNKLLTEYGRGNQNLVLLIDRLQKLGRVNHIKNSDLNQYDFPKHVKRKLLSNRADHDHIKAVVLSARKIAIAGDVNLMTDINSQPKYNGVQPVCWDCPSKFDYTR